jgi:hypothetical protein
MLGEDAMESTMLSRGRAAGGLLMLLGAWGALVPFVGPYFGFAFTPDKAWAYTSGRLWLSVVPGAAAFLGGLIVMGAGRIAAAGAVLAAVGGAWFVIGELIVNFAAASYHLSRGVPVTAAGSVVGPAAMRFLELLAFFYGLGVVIVFFAALALGKVIVAHLALRWLGDQATDAYERTDQYGAAY